MHSHDNTALIGGDLRVHRLGYGTMRLTGPGFWGPPADHDEAVRVLRRAIDLGINLIDTADSYGPHIAEELIAEALWPYPADLVISTKGGYTRQGPDRWKPVGNPAYLRQCVEMSLRRLRVERIDLYHLHRIDPAIPLEDQLGELADLQTEGKIGHIGLSEVEVDDIERARECVPIAAVQNIFSLTRQRMRDTLDHCSAHGIAFVPFFPLGKGDLARPDGPVAQVAATYGASASQLALAWLLHLSPWVVPIPGTSRVAHLEDNRRAADLVLTGEQMADLTARWSDAL
ncbi:oxidoreductase [Actinorhabdospora filicis]|uniref:Oxidoreductase n=1 Tax=Actinorhabdospora filicis TaxID=1785913 RepID=A0A9W6SM23_9ACTN|nr:aldo/keto reductase [Actinorhabdospora filicis]GLZ78301.1 oxidoreductase [Actinorhabdospora filicis]